MTPEPTIASGTLSAEPVIEIDALSCWFGNRFRKTHALRSVDLRVHQGEIFALLGVNGAGKSTAIRTLLGLHRPNGGQARVLGRNVTHIGTETLSRIGYVSQDQNWPFGTNLKRLIGQLAPLYPTWDEDFCRRLVERFQLDLNRPLKGQSRGHQARARLLLALAYRPELLVLDEPFGGLDPIARQDLVDGLLELTVQESWTVFLAGHEMSLVERLADRVGFLVDGRLTLVEPLEQLLGRCRRVNINLSSALPDSFSLRASEHWRAIQSDQHRIQFLDCQFPADEDQAEAEYRRRLPNIHSLEISRPSLNQVFVALCAESDLGG